MKFNIFSIFILCLLSFSAFAQKDKQKDKKEDKKVDKAWHLLDAKQNDYPGLSVELAYEKLVPKLKEPKEDIIVAVIDSGIDVDHEDLKDVMWVNTGEIPDNGIDDDENGYIDDVHGWNFLGNDQTNVNYDTFEVTREFKRLKIKYASLSEKQMKEDDEYEYYIKVEKEMAYQKKMIKTEVLRFTNLIYIFTKSNDFLKTYANVEKITPEVLDNIKSQDRIVLDMVAQMKEFLEQGLNVQRIEEINDYLMVKKHGYDINFDPRYIVGDDYNNLSDKFYGNNDYQGPKGSHGTHVAGIIAAKRNNGIGINGIAKHVKIMTVRAVPNGDERDKDIGNAIYYAINNGAKVINMSFGKSYSNHPEFVKKAMKYAEKKGVLMVHASGNSGEDTSIKSNFPNPLIDGKVSDYWLEIGASTADTDQLIADFSNYSKLYLSTFAPGHEIYSTYPDNEYTLNSGTSMAAPMVTGVAAFIWSYYPKIPAPALKQIILKSAVQYKGKFEKPKKKQEDPTVEITLNDISRNGGVVNAYNALKAAKKYYKKHKL